VLGFAGCYVWADHGHHTARQRNSVGGDPTKPFSKRSTDFRFGAPDSGVIADISQPLLGANTGLMHRCRESNYSITSSALIKMEFGIDKPSNVAVRALTISSWVVGSSMGMSPGLVPFRILSMKYPYRRN
jgi:hypothetical protein